MSDRGSQLVIRGRRQKWTHLFSHLVVPLGAGFLYSWHSLRGWSLPRALSYSGPSFPSLSAVIVFLLCIHQFPSQHLLPPLLSDPAVLVFWAALGHQEASIQGPVLEEPPNLKRWIWIKTSPTSWGQEWSRRRWATTAQRRTSSLLGQVGRLPGGGVAGARSETMGRNVCGVLELGIVSIQDTLPGLAAPCLSPSSQQ